MLTKRNEARDWFKICGLTYQDVTLKDKYLQILLDEQFNFYRKEAAEGNGYEYWVRINNAKYFKGHYDENGKLIDAYLTGKGAYFAAREVVSFNRDGFIGFCGAACDDNTEPVVLAFVEWRDWLKDKKGGAE